MLGLVSSSGFTKWLYQFGPAKLCMRVPVAPHPANTWHGLLSILTDFPATFKQNVTHLISFPPLVTTPLVRADSPGLAPLSEGAAPLCGLDRRSVNSLVGVDLSSTPWNHSIVSIQCCDSEEVYPRSFI